MNTIRRIGFGLTACIGLFLYGALPASAYVVSMCGPEAPGTSSGPKYVTNPSTGGGSYTLGPRGCALMTPSDAAYFAGRGYTQGGGNGVIAASFSANGTMILPAHTYIDNIVINEVAASDVTGGVDIGTSSGATDVVNALSCSASCLKNLADTTLLKRIFSATVPQTLYVQAGTNWTTTKPTINVTVMYRNF